MRIFYAAAGLLTLCLWPALSTAQVPRSRPAVAQRSNADYESSRPYEEDTAVRPMVTRQSFAQRQIYQRALHRARQRAARMEARKAMGRSPLRPSVLDAPHVNNLNRALVEPYYGYFSQAWMRSRAR